MKSSMLDIPFPLKGLQVNTSFDAQPVGTTRSALNVRGYNPRLGQDQGAQRSGLTRFMQANLGSPVQDLTHCVINATQAQVTPVGEISTAPLPVGPEGTVAVLMGDTNNLATLLFTSGATYVIPKSPLTGNCYGMFSCWDANGNLYILADAGGTSFRVCKYRVSEGAAFFVWQTTTLTVSTGVLVPSMCFGGDFVWVWQPNTSPSSLLIIRINRDTGATTTMATLAGQNGDGAFSNALIDYCNGYLCYLSPSGAPADGAVQCVPETFATSPVELQLATTNISVVDICNDGSNFYVLAYGVAGAKAVLSKVSPLGVRLWSKTLAFSTSYTVAYNNTRNVVAVAGTDSSGLYLYRPDNGVFIKFVSGGNWNCNRYRKGTGYVRSLFSGSTLTVTRSDEDGGILSSQNVTVGSGVKRYEISISPTPVTVPAAVLTQTLSLAVQRILSVAGGNVRRITRSGPESIGGGTGALFSGAAVTFSVQQNQQVFFADGVNYKLYDGPTDSILPWQPTAGALPQDSAGNKPRLIELWRNRIVLGGLPNDPYNYFMSAVNDATDFDYNPVPSVETQALAGNLHESGQWPDIVTSFIPYSDEILIGGCDHSIHQMTGDPAAGGRIDLITEKIGMAWGRPWCRDSFGSLYFMSSRGSIYRFSPQSEPERISEMISELLVGVDHGDQIIRMAWDERQFGFHVFLTYYKTKKATFHFFYDHRNGAWWMDQFANLDHNPLCTHTVDDNSPGGRNILIGTIGGQVMMMDPKAVTDDGTPISSYVYLGPIKEKMGNAQYLNDLQTSLDSSSSDVQWDVFAGPDAQAAFASSSRQSGTFRAGRNRSPSVRVMGHALYVRLGSPGMTAWALEYMRAEMSSPRLGTRQRAF